MVLIASMTRIPAAPHLRRWHARWLGDIGWSGVGIVVIASVINATRRGINFVFTPTFVGWIESWIVSFGTTMLIGVVMLVAVAVAVNRHPRQCLRQYIAVALAIVVSCAVVIPVMVAIETEGTFAHDDRFFGLMTG